MKFTKSIILLISLLLVIQQISTLLSNRDSKNKNKDKNKSNKKHKNKKSLRRREDPPADSAPATPPADTQATPATDAAPATPPADGAATPSVGSTSSEVNTSSTSTAVCCEKKTGNVTVKSTKSKKEDCDGTVLPLSSCAISFPTVRYSSLIPISTTSYLPSTTTRTYYSPIRYINYPRVIRYRKEGKDSKKKSVKKDKQKNEKNKKKKSNKN
jgi:hypothetical protein